MRTRITAGSWRPGPTPRVLCAVGWSVAILTWAIGCAGEPALERLLEARATTAELLVQFTKAADATNRVVMADTDNAAAAFAREAEQATEAVLRNTETLKPLLVGLSYSDEAKLLEEFGGRFAEYRALDDQIRGLAVENTNVKAQRLSFGPAQEAANAFRDSLDAVARAAHAQDSWQMRALAATALAAVREIQVLQALHIPEATEAVMTGLEKQMATAEAAARGSLDRMKRVVEPASRSDLASAIAALDRFMGIHGELVSLSRRNTNVRSLALALGQRRPLPPDARTAYAPCRMRSTSVDSAAPDEPYKLLRFPLTRLYAPESNLDFMRTSRTTLLVAVSLAISASAAVAQPPTPLRSAALLRASAGQASPMSAAAVPWRNVHFGAALERQVPPAQEPPAIVEWTSGGFLDVAYLHAFNDPPNKLFRSRGTAWHLDDPELNMMAAYVKKKASEQSRWGMELVVQTGKDDEIFGFSATAPNMAGSKFLRHLGLANVSYLAPAGKGLTLQGGIFGSLIGYDGLYAKDNINYTRPWGADFTPYLMLGVNASYPLTDKLTGTFYVVNGYWHLADANSVPSSGVQLAYKATPQVTVKNTVLWGPHQSNTSLEFWRFISDTIVERRTDRVIVALNAHFSTEQVDSPDRFRAWWMTTQVPMRWNVQGPWSVAIRPEIAWDSSGRWTLAEQTVTALTSTLEYRVPYKWATTILRLEHRVDDSRGPGGGFFTRDARSPDGIGLQPTQNLLIFAAILTFDSPSQR